MVSFSILRPFGPYSREMLRAGKRTHRLGFYRGITYRDRCECNKGGRKIADEWKLLGYECYKRGLRERELVGQTTSVVQ